jgi:hypothetical protein
LQNRFQDKPEIYKQFLEILQTYQRESEPIQDVYAQVTTLFSDATDLLEDFKQFLPESAAQAKAAAKLAEDSAAMNLAGVAQTPQAPQGNRADPKLPAVGNFPPPSTGKENKKRVRNVPAVATPMGALSDANNMRGSIAQGGNANKVRGEVRGTACAFISPPESSRELLCPKSIWVSNKIALSFVAAAINLASGSRSGKEVNLANFCLCPQSYFIYMTLTQANSEQSFLITRDQEMKVQMCLPH